MTKWFQSRHRFFFMLSHCHSLRGLPFSLCNWAVNRDDFYCLSSSYITDIPRSCIRTIFLTTAVNLRPKLERKWAAMTASTPPAYIYPDSHCPCSVITHKISSVWYGICQRSRSTFKYCLLIKNPSPKNMFKLRSRTKMSKNYLLLLILKWFSIDYNHENCLSSNTFNACNCFKRDNNKIYFKKKSLYSLHLGSGEISVLTSAGFYLFTKTLQLSRLYLAASFRGSLSVIHSEVFPY